MLVRPTTFLSRVSILTRDIDIANLSVRYVPVSDENGLTYRHSFFHHTVAQSLQFQQHQTFYENSDGVTTPCGGAKYRCGIKLRDFLPISRYISQTIQYIAIVTMEGEQELVCDLSNGAISNDLERTITLFSRSHHSLTLNISQTATDTAIVTIEGEQETASKLSNGTNFNDFE